MMVLIIGLVILLVGVGIVAVDLNLVPMGGAGGNATNQTKGPLPDNVAGIPMIGVGAGLAIIGALVTVKSFSMW